MTDPISLAKNRSDCEPKNIDTLVRLVKDLKSVPGCIVECGAYRCGATIAMASANPDKKVYSFDLFGGLPYGEGQPFDNFGKTDFDEIQSVTSRFANIELIRGRHEETVPEFATQPISMIFMDSDFYSSHAVCLKHFWPMLSSGGVVIFHDWSFPEVQQAINEILNRDDCTQWGTISDSPNMGWLVKK